MVLKLLVMQLWVPQGDSEELASDYLRLKVPLGKGMRKGVGTAMGMPGHHCMWT